MTAQGAELVEALKPCPFCGGEAEMDTRRAYRALNGAFGDACAIYCLTCGADMNVCYKDVDGWTVEDAVAHLTEAWNKRAAQAEIEELKAEIGRLTKTLDAERYDKNVQLNKVFTLHGMVRDAEAEIIEAWNALGGPQAKTIWDVRSYEVAALGDTAEQIKLLRESLSTVKGETLEEAAKIADELSDKIMRKAERHHRKEEYDRYEALECEASIVADVAAKIRKAIRTIPAQQEARPSACGGDTGRPPPTNRAPSPRDQMDALKAAADAAAQASDGRSSTEAMAAKIMSAWMLDERWLGHLGCVPYFWAEIAAKAIEERPSTAPGEKSNVTCSLSEQPSSVDRAMPSVEEIIEALKPFAEIAESFTGGTPDSYEADCFIPAGDFRRARAVIDSIRRGQ